MARYSWTTPMRTLNNKTNPNRPSWPAPNTRISTNAVPRIALNRVKMFARRISENFRLVRSSATLTCPARTRCATSSALSPSGPVVEAAPAIPVSLIVQTLPIRRPGGAPVAQATSRYRDTAMTEEPPVTCYRHPDRETGRRCTRCGRPACPECLQEASVGSHCVECVNAAAPSTGQRVGVLVRGQNLIATKAIIGLNVVAFAVFALSDSRADGTGRTSFRFVLLGPLVHQGEWWRIFTSSFVHYGLLHLFFNMLLLWIIGQLLEPGAGPLRFTLLYVVSVAAGSAAALIVSPLAATAARPAACSDWLPPPPL